MSTEPSASLEYAEDPVLPMTVYGVEISYFTGKLECVLRYMGLPYTRMSKGPMGEVADVSGTAQIPALLLADGRCLTDTTPIIAWLDDRYPHLAVTPKNSLTAFCSRLLEDYADEWLWRPAMHYRWDYPESAKHQSRVLAAEHGDIPLPEFLKRYLITNRQRKFFTRGDGVTAATWDHVEKIFYDTLAQFSAILENRPYLLGERPSLADFGFFGPMFRHFSMDPTSARIMRETAPAVFEWVARMWNARNDKVTGDLLQGVPEDWGPILESVGGGYLPYLAANAEAWVAGHAHFDVTIADAPYRTIRTSEYRVWCLQEIRRQYQGLSEADQAVAGELLRRHGCWEPLWRSILPDARWIDNESAPFNGAGTMTGMTHKQAHQLHWWPVAAASRT